MMRHVYSQLLQVVLLAAIIALALGINYIAAATWAGPTALPPGNNISAPLNVGTTDQVKDANLSVGHSSNTASDYGLISYGRLRSTVGGVEFPDGTLQTTAFTNSNPSFTNLTATGTVHLGSKTVYSCPSFDPGTNRSCSNYCTGQLTTLISTCSHEVQTSFNSQNPQWGCKSEVCIATNLSIN